MDIYLDVGARLKLWNFIKELRLQINLESHSPKLTDSQSITPSYCYSFSQNKWETELRHQMPKYDTFPWSECVSHDCRCVQRFVVCLQITRGLTQELNRLYSLFCSRNPDFEKNGKVSIVAHSLGCVITFDIMTGWDPVRFHHQQMLDPEKTKIRWPSEEERQLQEQLRVLRLRWCIEKVRGSGPHL